MTLVARLPHHDMVKRNTAYQAFVAASLLLTAGISAQVPSPGVKAPAAASLKAAQAAVTDSLVIELRVNRLTPGAGPVLVSSGIPLKAGAISASDVSRARVEVEGREVPAYVSALSAKWADGSLRSILVQFELSGDEPPPVSAALVFGTRRPLPRRTGPKGELGFPTAVALPISPDYLVETAVAGPTLTMSQTRTVSSLAKYDDDFKRLANQHWKATGDAWEQNYYDRSLVYYVAWMRSGNLEYWLRATKLALNYRREYVERNNYGVSPHWAQLGGLELHYLLTGDTLSRRSAAGIFAVGMINFSLPVGAPLAEIANPKGGTGENRIQARVLQAALSAYRMGASYTRPDGYAPGGAFSPATWPTRLRDILNKILSTQNPNGSYSWIQICNGQLNYMVGMLNDVLIEYYRDFEADPRIPVAIEKANEYLWTTQWLSGDQAFKYASVPCSPNAFGTSVGGPEPAGDLNGLLIASFGWLYQRTGDQKWRTRGDAIMAGLLSPGWSQSYSGSKQFNQAYSASYRYLAYRARRS